MMLYRSFYASPLGTFVLVADEKGLCELYFNDQSNNVLKMTTEVKEEENDVIRVAKRWLDFYFAGEIPDFLPSLHFKGTAFQQKVWHQLLIIPYGITTSYGEIAKQIDLEQKKKTSPRAVGMAISKNPILLIIPCHRVIEKNGKIGGYAAGVERKIQLLAWEKHRVFKNKEKPLKIL
ncbi:MAG: methylated-DNA--[protein]-cysteine S-methyltransferase [Erysipelotrichaceae bacterium]|nr:methylated-DNA--[protein]-cysteine S-methyltransferase [Erysipelotrichaceae bacterium]